MFKITFRTDDHIARIWQGFATYGEALAALRDADLAIPFHWVAKIEEESPFEAAHLEALIEHATQTAEILEDHGGITPEALRADLAKANRAYGLSPEMLEHAARIFETRHAVRFPRLADA
jgi:hypothetical protein